MSSNDSLTVDVGSRAVTRETVLGQDHPALIEITDAAR
jgi:hypothetical protein